jgi:respiratory burst oxidase
MTVLLIIQVIAWGVAVGAGLHIIPHLTCDFPRILHETDQEYATYLAQFFGSKRPPNYWWFVKGVEGITGLILTICMVIMYVLAQPLFRRGKLSKKNKLRNYTGFNTFWYSHHLFIVVYITFIVHGVCLYISRTWYKKTVSINSSIMLKFASHLVYQNLRWIIFFLKSKIFC